MKAALYSLITALMIWLPVGQAAALCCPAAEHADAEMAMPMPESAASHCAHGLDDDGSADTGIDAGCLSACAQLGHMPVPVMAATVREPIHHDAPLVPSSVATLAAHRMPLLRPPSRS